MRVIVITDDSVEIPDSLPHLIVPPGHTYSTKNVRIGDRLYIRATVKFELMDTHPEYCRCFYCTD